MQKMEVSTLGMPSDQASSDPARMAIEPSAVTECRPPASADIFPGVGFRIRRESSPAALRCL